MCFYSSLQTRVRSGTGLQEVERCHSVQPETGAACLCNPCAGSSFGRKGMWALRTVMSVNEHHFYNSQLLRDSRRGSKRNPSQDCSNSGPRGFKGCEYVLELCTLHSVYKDWAPRLKIILRFTSGVHYAHDNPE